MAKLPSALQIAHDFKVFYRPADGGEDQYVLQHKNGLCVVGVAERHPLLTPGCTVVKVDYDVGSDRDRNQLQVSGKQKKGAIQTDPNMCLCRVSCSDGTSYLLRACVGGKLIEINTRLLRDPQLLQRSPARDGYLGLVMPPTNYGQDNDSTTRPPPNKCLLDGATYDALRPS